ncbi:MAG: hypothetical protein ACE5DI_02140 [Candidatus Micrarchaeia archaeon]
MNAVIVALLFLFAVIDAFLFFEYSKSRDFLKDSEKKAVEKRARDAVGLMELQTKTLELEGRLRAEVSELKNELAQLLSKVNRRQLANFEGTGEVAQLENIRREHLNNLSKVASEFSDVSERLKKLENERLTEKTAVFKQ